MSLPPSRGGESERQMEMLPEETHKLEIYEIPFGRGSNVFYYEEVISISHDDVTNIQLCIYRDTPKSACLSAVPSHSQVPHRLCMCACMCTSERRHPSYLCKIIWWDTPTSIHGTPVEKFPTFQMITVVAVSFD